jgi:hypothetical protein
MVWTGSRVIAIADWDSRCAMISLVSPDGLTWEMGFLGGNACLTRLAWNGSVVMAIGPGGEITTSPDGTYWTHLPSVTNAGTLTGVVWNGSQWVLSADAGVLTSPDGSSWTLHPDPGGGAPPMMKAVHVIENKAIAVSDARTAVVTGADPVPVWLPGGGPDALAWSGRYAVGVSGSGTRPGEPNSGLLEHSIDGLQWKLNESEPLSTPLHDIVWTGTQFVAVGMHGAILTSGAAPEPRINLSGGQLQLSWDRFSNFDLYGIESSADLRTWTSVAPDINGESWSVPIDTLGPGRFLRVRAR